ncbi:VOC family protein [Pseudozobellia thermophila]|uniref:VOC domain-containing protein n=1 Tax=Pseudozobellia thermophila TaxID=192903 RepID=A0A1M6NZZ5_9FLAO|nr:glyoxalase [Pseudozobellia thermophila]SHK01285.1 hypothetical protein SAMN04488513_1178 [Pseudozobellia thermophila]
MNLDHVEILTDGVEQTKAYYGEVLELPIAEYDSKSVSIKIGSSTLRFVETPKRSRPIYHFAFNIPENKLNEAIDWCAGRIELIQEKDAVLIADFERWNANAVYFYDNNGNILEFIARHDLKNSTTVPFGSRQLLNISEIGIVSENPLELGQRLIEEHDLVSFGKNEDSETFTALGDDNGLLIIVKNNRNWYPTDIPAKANRTNIGLTHMGQKKTIEVSG